MPTPASAAVSPNAAMPVTPAAIAASPDPATIIVSSVVATALDTDPVTRLHKRAIRYYLRRAKEPSSNQKRKSKHDLPPRPDSVTDLHRCHWGIMLCLVLLALSVTFIVCYCLLPALRTNLGACEGIACSTSVVCLLASVLVLTYNGVEIWRVHRDARKYADFVTAMVDKNGRFNIKPTDDSDYVDYIRAYGEGSIIIVQREYYDWFMNGTPPVRQVPADYVPVELD